MNNDLKRAEAGDVSSGDEAAPPYAPTDNIKLTGKTSPGVKRMEVISKHITFKDRILLFIAIFVLAYAYTLDNTLRYTFQVTPPRRMKSSDSNVTILADVRNRQLRTALTSSHGCCHQKCCGRRWSAYCCEDCRCFWSCRTSDRHCGVLPCWYGSFLMEELTESP